MQLRQYMTYTFQQKWINACQYIQKYIQKYFNYISKTIELIMKLHVKMYLRKSYLSGSKH